MECSSIAYRPCLVSQDCYDGKSSTAYCWIFAFFQIFLSLLLLAFPLLRKSGVSFYFWVIGRGDSIRKYRKKLADKRQFHMTLIPNSSKVLENVKEINNNNQIINQDEEEGQSVKAITSSITVIKEEEESEPREKHFFLQDEIENKEEVETEKNISPLFRTQRSEENFMKNNEDETINFPSHYESEYITLHQDNGKKATQVLKQIFSQKEAIDMVRTSAGFALLSSGLSSLFGIFFAYGDYLEANCGKTGDIHIRNWLFSGAQALDQTIENFKFLPLFMILAAFAFLVDRWQRFMMSCHTIQGRLQGIGNLCGSFPTSPMTKLSKRKLYTIYRYLNVIHILCYKSFSPSLNVLDDDIFVFATKFKLLTIDEAGIIFSMENKAREGMAALLSDAVDDLLKLSDKEKNVISRGTVLSSKICDLRAECGGLHDLFVRDNPNEYVVSIQLLIDIFKILVLLASPAWGLFHGSIFGILACIQPGVFLGVFFTFFALSFPFVIFKALQNPFAENSGINVDNLIANTEFTLFQSMRALWHKDNEAHVFRRSDMLFRKSMMSKARKGGFGEL